MEMTLLTMLMNQSRRKKYEGAFLLPSDKVGSVAQVGHKTAMGLPCNLASVSGLGDADELVRRGCMSRRSAISRIGVNALIGVPKRHVNSLVLRTCNTHKLPARFHPR